MAVGDVNPFATRFIRPGAIPFRFAAGESLEGLLGRLRDQQWWGQILGPHGSGKSTLLTTLCPALEAAGRRVIWITMRHGEHRLPPWKGSLDAPTQLVIDGFEQLGWLARRRVKSRCRRASAGLLVTTHRDLGLPTLFETRPNERLAAELVATLLPAGQTDIREADIQAAYTAAGKNLREMLFRLYDVYEAQRQGRA